MAVTCVNGNTSLDNVVVNVQRTLAACDRADVPVFSGARRALLQKPFDASYIHGEDGLGDAPSTDEFHHRMPVLEAEHAVDGE